MGRAQLERRDLRLADGSLRWYLLTEPATAPPPYPLVVQLHGFGEGAEFHARATGLSAHGAVRGFMTVVPDGTLAGSRDAPQWETTLRHNPDVDFLDALIADASGRWPIDLDRVYVVGMSNGALFGSVLSYRLAHRIAAAALVAGARFPRCGTPRRAVPTIVVHGRKDPLVPFAGGPLQVDALRREADLRRSGPRGDDEDLRDLDPPAMPQMIDEWATRHGATRSGRQRRNAGLVVTEWQRDGVKLFALCELQCHGHSWPGSAAYRGLEGLLGPMVEDFPTNELIWQFLSRHRLASRD